MIATLAEYQKLVADRPAKFTEKQSGFMPVAPDEKRCSGCWHWAQVPNQHRSVCEVVAPAGEDRTVPPEATCAFYTVDGVTFPKYPKAKPAEKKREREF